MLLLKTRNSLLAHASVCSFSKSEMNFALLAPSPRRGAEAVERYACRRSASVLCKVLIREFCDVISKVS